MPTFYNFTQDGLIYSFDDIFVPADLFREGNLWAWGEGTQGELGDATFTNKSTPVTTFIGGSNWKSVNTGSSFSAAIKTDGTLWTWGSSFRGQLGNGTTTSALDGNGISTPITTFSGGTNWKQVSCGSDQILAIKTDGTLWAWGWNPFGQLGNASTATSVSTPITTFSGGTNWKQVSCGLAFSAAIKTDGTLWTWGENDNVQLGINATGNRSTPVTTFAGGNNWKQVSCQGDSAAAIKTDGTLWTWGDNFSGKLGDATTVDKSTPVTTFLGGNNWKQVSVGWYHISAIKNDGTLWLWGYNAFGQLGDNTTTNKSTPITTFSGGSNWKESFNSMYSSAAIKTDGTLWTWGQNDFGILGNGTTASNRSTPVTTFAGGTNWNKVSNGNSIYHMLAVTYIDF